MARKRSDDSRTVELEDSERTVVWFVRLGKAIYARASEPVAFFMGLAGIISLVGQIGAHLFGLDAAALIPSATLALVTLGATYVSVISQRDLILVRNSNRSARRLKAAQPAIEKQFRALGEALNLRLHEPDQRLAIKQQGDQAMRDLAQAFALLTGHECRATVKAVAEHPEHKDQLRVFDRFRSDPSVYSAVDGKEDVVSQNTHFSELMTPGAIDPWVCGDICAEAGYQNSHISREDLLAGNVRYRSIMSMRIARGRDVVGFLCLDSQTTSAFQRETIDTVARQAAYTLYNLMHPTEDEESL